jgi:hypothetical protein
LLAAEPLSAPDDAGILAFPVGRFAFGRADAWFRVDRGENFTTVSVEQRYCSLPAMRRPYMACLALVLAAMAGLGNYVKRWRAALHVIVSALVVAILGLAISPVAHASAAAATLSVTSTWQTGFIARFTITNPSTVPLTDWKLEFDLPMGESVSHTWNSKIAQSGTHYVLTPANWNRIIAPGGSATGGFRGVLTGSYSPPSNCLLNGQYPCT